MLRSRAGVGGEGGDERETTTTGYAGTANQQMGDVTEEGSSSLGPEIDEDRMWEMNLRAKEAGTYPERPGEQDCAYYIRTGLCKYGMTCKFNHPLDRKLAVAAARMTGAFPERVGQQECQYYLKTGTCKFGVTCKFHHPKDKAGIAGKAPLNSLGYPLRPNETECSYYLRTGQCKFGNTCKFHHPQLSNMMVPFSGSHIYPTVHSPTTPGQQSYLGVTNWPLSRTSYIPNPRWQSPSSYPLILPQALVQVPGWNTYAGQLGSVSLHENQQQMHGNSQLYVDSLQSGSANSAQGAFPSYQSGSNPIEMYAWENVFPERPGEQECVFYMKTGDCKYGAACRYHHPRERSFPVTDCVLSSLGLPLRPGEPLCIFYSRYGICKFGPNCKFHHPEGTMLYDHPVSSSASVPVVRHLPNSSTGATSLPLSSKGDVEDIHNSRQLSNKEPLLMASGGDKVDIDGSHTPTSIGPVSSFS